MMFNEHCCSGKSGHPFNNLEVLDFFNKLKKNSTAILSSEHQSSDFPLFKKKVASSKKVY